MKAWRYPYIFEKIYCTCCRRALSRDRDVEGDDKEGGIAYDYVHLLLTHRLILMSKSH